MNNIYAQKSEVLMGIDSDYMQAFSHSDRMHEVMRNAYYRKLLSHASFVNRPRISPFSQLREIHQVGARFAENRKAGGGHHVEGFFLHTLQELHAAFAGAPTCEQWQLLT